MGRAPFILIEGLDRSGKTTQVSALADRLHNAQRRVKLLKFPDRTTPIGKMIDAYLKSESELDDHVIHLLFSANRWELASTIEELLNSGTTVVCDRYVFSGISFSAAKGLALTWCRSPDISLPAPDLTLFLDISPEKARERGGYGEERYEKEALQREVRKIFHSLGGQVKDSGAKWVEIDAGQDRDAVGADIWAEVSKLPAEIAEPLRKLWMDQLSTGA